MLLHKVGAPVWLRAVFRELFSEFQPAAPTPGATQVHNGPQLEAAVAAAIAGEVIELASPGAYVLSATLTITADNITIASVVTGAYITGAYRIQSGAVNLTFKAVDFLNGDLVYTLYFPGGSHVLKRCRFAGNTQIAISTAGTEVIDACLILGTYSHSGVRVSGGTATARNCIANFSGAGIGFNNTGGTFNCYNCAADVFGAEFFGCGGDYNADVDGSAPGANSVHAIIWGNEFDAEYRPILATSTLYTAGTFAQVPAADYYGNPFTNPPPIGALVYAV